MQILSFIFSILFLFFISLPGYGASSKLVIYTYSSFSSEWGPGPAIEKKFENQCDCEIEWVVADDGGALLSRLQLEGEKNRADIVLGLDNNLAGEAKKLGIFTQHGLTSPSFLLPIEWNDAIFLPFDFGFFSFIYDREKMPNPPASMQELVNSPNSQKIIIQDPRSSTPGLGLLLWLQALYGDKAPDIWKKLKGRILTVSKGWTEAYGLFLKGEAPMVLSYTSSPAYHLIVEKTDRYAAALFSEGHYVQVELAAKTKKGASNPLADQFMAFILKKDFQGAIPEGNWMYPVTGFDDLPQVYKDLPVPPHSFSLPPEEIADHKQEWLAAWLKIMAE